MAIFRLPVAAAAPLYSGTLAVAYVSHAIAFMDHRSVPAEQHKLGGALLVGEASVSPDPLFVAGREYDIH